MWKHAIAALVLTAFASLMAAGVNTCEGPADTKSCCCAVASSPFPSIASRACCEARCGRTSNDVPSTPTDSADAQQTITLPADPVRVSTSEEPVARAAVPVGLKSAELAILHQDPPDVYVRTASFLI